MTEDGDGDIVTFRLAPRDRAAIQRLVEQGEFRNRSDFLRYAVKSGLQTFGAPGERPRVDLELEDYAIRAPEPAATPTPRRRREMHRP